MQKCNRNWAGLKHLPALRAAACPEKCTSAATGAQTQFGQTSPTRHWNPRQHSANVADGKTGPTGTRSRQRPRQRPRHWTDGHTFATTSATTSATLDRRANVARCNAATTFCITLAVPRVAFNLVRNTFAMCRDGTIWSPSTALFDLYESRTVFNTTKYTSGWSKRRTSGEGTPSSSARITRARCDLQHATTGEDTGFVTHTLHRLAAPNKKKKTTN